MKRIILAISLLGLFACETPTQEVNNLSYYKDERTGLCFVLNSVSSNPVPGSQSIYCYVPCTPEVEKIIAEQKNPPDGGK